MCVCVCVCVVSDCALVPASLINTPMHTHAHTYTHTHTHTHTNHQAGLASIKDRVYKEIVDRYGFKEEFTRCDAETMREVLHVLREKYVV